MTKVQVAISSGAVVISIMVFCGFQRQALTRLREENLLLRQQLERAAELEQSNEQLSNQLAAAQNPQTAAKGDQSELLKLRGEVGSLRRLTNELGKINAENQRLKASLASAGGQSKVETISASPTGGLPKESWSFAGYGDPESAFQTAVWAMSQGDAKTILASLAPDGPQFKEMAAQSEEEISTKSKAEFAKVTGFKIIDREILSNDDIIVVAYAFGINESARIRLQRSGNEWKITGPIKDNPRPATQ